eukprot:2016750-Rhodomonas_salina.2
MQIPAFLMQIVLTRQGLAFDFGWPREIKCTTQYSWYKLYWKDGVLPLIFLLFRRVAVRRNQMQTTARSVQTVWGVPSNAIDFAARAAGWGCAPLWAGRDPRT